jgi:hypothetical protein
MEQDVLDRVAHDAGNVVNPDVASELYGHVETDYGPGGATDERITEAAPGVKLERAAAVLDGREGVELQPVDPSGGPDGKAMDGDRVYVGNVHEAPDGKLVHKDSDGGLYYTNETGPGGQDGAERTAGFLGRLRGALPDK